ncbi:MAG: molybdenum ABC transporter ATP-binding protein [Oceanobacter sp.]
MKALKVRLSLSRSDFKLEVDETIPLEGVTVLFGESGSGKTTLLRCIAGLEKAEGEVLLGNDVWQTQKDFKPVWKRNLAYVFQEHSLLEHLTAEQNIEYGIKRSRSPVSAEERGEIIALLGLEERIKRYPSQLSGGERQRVAIARALLKKPALLLMDEPLSALDQKRKHEILPYLELMKHELKIPILYVTHSLDELSRLGDQVIVLDAGAIVCAGKVKEVLGSGEFSIPNYEDPGVIVDGVIAEHDSDWGLTAIDFEGGRIWLRKINRDVGMPARIRVLAKDVSLAISPPVDTSILNVIPAVVHDHRDDRSAGLIVVNVQIGKTRLLSRMSLKSFIQLGLECDKTVWVMVKTAAIL